jgi:capsid protein
MDWQFGTPGFGMTGDRKLYTRIPAEEIIHYARYIDGDSTRPAPWSASVIQKSRHLDKYEEAEVVAARVSACKLGFFTSSTNAEGGEGMGDRPDPTKEATMDAEPGSFTGLKWGIDFKEWNPEHPNGNFDLFRKGMLRAWCAGMPGANYNIIANDLEGVNYSSGRLGMLDERELWKLIQKFDIEIAERPIFEAWLEMALMTGAIPLPLAKFDKFNRPIFRGRRWAWVDPLKEVEGSALQVANNFTSRTRVIEDSDVDADFEQIAFELAEEKMLLDELGLDTAPMVGKVPATKPAQDTASDQPAAPDPATSKELTKKDMTTVQILELIRATQSQTQSAITVNVPPIVVPEIIIPEIKMPEQKTPVVHIAAARVTIPEIKVPDVVVNVPAPLVTVRNVVTIPTTKKLKVTKRDSDGKMSEVTVEKD